MRTAYVYVVFPSTSESIMVMVSVAFTAPACLLASPDMSVTFATSFHAETGVSDWPVAPPSRTGIRGNSLQW